MGHTSSFGTATTVGAPSASSVQREVDTMHQVIKKERGDKHTAIIAIVRAESLGFLDKACQVPWWKRWTGNSTVLFTTDDDLQDTIKRLRCYQQCHKLAIVASSHIERISYKVHSQFKTLIILRCGGHRQTGSSSRVLLIDGASTFNHIRADRWQEKERANKLILGSNVVIEVGTDWSYSTESFASNLSAEKKRRMETYLDEIERADKSGEWWQEWKGSIAAMLGLVAGGSKFAIGLDAAAKGMIVHFQWGNLALKAASASLKLSTVATGAGPAILLGVGVAAAVYFIPWPDVFTWLEEIIFSHFRNWFAALWERFRSWASRQMEFFDNTSGSFKFTR